MDTLPDAGRKKRVIIFDCDTGIDDSFALLYLLAHPDVELTAIVSTAGNVPLEYVHDNNRGWLTLLDRTTIPVYRGAKHPLCSQDDQANFAQETHADHGLGFAQLPTISASWNEPALTGAQAWIELSYRYPGELIGLVTGPGTTLALAMIEDPSLPSRLQSLVIMGGAFQHPGNTSPLSEWNIAWDPEAFRHIIRSYETCSLPVNYPILCPLDVTEQILFTPHHFSTLCQQSSTNNEILTLEDAAQSRSSHPHPIIRVLSDALRFYYQFHYQDRGIYAAHMHDPLAAAIAVTPHLAQLVFSCVDVELRGEFSRGKTIVDPYHRWGKPNNAYIVESVNISGFIENYIAGVANLLRTYNP